MSELDAVLSDTERTYGLRQIPAGHARMLVIGRDFPEPIGEAWGALSDPGRVGTCFGVTPAGEFRPGGDYEVPGIATGTILRCDPPRLLTVSWLPPGGSAGEVEIRLADDDGATRLELRYASVRKRFAVIDAETNEWAGGAGWEFFLDNLAAALQDRDMLPWASDWHSLEGRMKELYEARNAEWERVREQFEQEYAPLPAPE